MSSIFLIFLLFFLPLIINPFGPFAFEQPKVMVAELAIELFAILFIASVHKFRHFRFHTLQLLCCLGLVILTLLQFSDGQYREFVYGSIFRLQGIYLLWHLLVFCILSSYFFIPQHAQRYAAGVLIVLFLSCFFLPTVNGRSVGTMGEPNALAAAAVFLLPFLWSMRDRYSWVMWMIGILGGMGALLLSGSRSGLVAIGIMVMVVVLVRCKVRLWIATLVCIVMMLGSWYLPFLDRVPGEFQQQRALENRSEIWETALQAGWEKPVSGHGFGNIQQPLTHASQTLDNNIRFQVVDSSHNFFLDMWVQGGAIGLGLILMLLGRSLYLLVRMGRTLEIAALLGVLTCMSFNPVSVVTLVAFWWVVGQGFYTERVKILQ